MKKTLLSLLTILIWSATFAQVRVMDIREYRPSVERADLFDYSLLNGISADVPSARSSSGPLEFIAIGTSYNIFSILLQEQSMVDYDADLDAVTFIHRHNAGTTGGSGGLSFDISTDGGATWTDNIALTPDFNAGSVPENGGNRYPSMTIWNPGTGVDDARVVGFGPSLIAGASWGYQFQVSAAFDGSAVCEDYNQDGGYIPYGLTCLPNGDIWGMSAEWNATGDAANDTLNRRTMKLHKASYNETSGCFDWEVALTIEPDYVDYIDPTTAAAGKASVGQYSIGFDPTGTTGYAVHMGMENSAVYSGIQPNVWKTEDGGATWNRLPDFDFPSLPAFTDFIITNSSGDQIPYFSTSDLEVDGNGRLHIVSEMLSGFSSDPDSLYWIFAGAGTSGIFDVSTTDGSDWEALFIDTIRVTDGTLGDISVTTNATVSRSADGMKLFYTWSGSDPLLLETNDLPNIYCRAYDVESGDFTFINNFTAGTSYDGITYFPATSPEVISGGDDFDYEIPIVFAEPGGTDVDPPQYYYAKGIGFNEDDFGALAPQAVAGFTYVTSGFTTSFTNTSQFASGYIWDFGDGSALNSSVNPTHLFAENGTYEVCLTAQNVSTSDEYCEDVSIQASGIEDVVLNNALSLYPSPTTGLVNLVINSNSFEQARIEVYNMLGDKMMEGRELDLRMSNSLSLDLSGFADGTYLVKVQADNGMAVKRVSLVR